MDISDIEELKPINHIVAVINILGFTIGAFNGFNNWGLGGAILMAFVGMIISGIISRVIISNTVKEFTIWGLWQIFGLGFVVFIIWIIVKLWGVGI